jgi:hypothetical protein
LRHARRRSNCRIVQTTLPRRVADRSDEIPETRRKSDAILTHHFRQRDRDVRAPSLFIAGSNDSVITGLIGAKRVNELDRVPP